MANPVYVQPDAVLALMQYLHLRSELMALIASDHIVTEIPASPTYPYVVVQEGGGTGIWPAIDEPALQVDTVGGTKPQCSLIARTVRACIWAIANDVVPAGVLCSGADTMRMAYIPDTVPTPPLPRFTARYSILLHP
jgi:hypothetical protein